MFTLLLAAGAVHAQVTMENIGSLGGWPDCAVARGNHVFVILGRSLSVFEFTGVQFTRVASIQIEEEPYNMVLEGNRIYAFSRWSSLAMQVFDVSDPLNPVHVTSLITETQTYARGSVYGSIACMALGDRLLVADVSGDTAVVTAIVTTPAKAVSISGQHVYIGHDNGLTVFDISTPSNPVQKGSLTGDKVTCLKSAGSTVYVGFDTYPNIGFGVVDATDPMHPTRIGFVQTKVTIGSSTWFKSPDVLDIEGQYAYLGCHGSVSLFVVYIADAANPSIAGMNEFIVSSNAWTVSSIDAEGQYAYIVISSGDFLGLYAIDVINKAAPAVRAVLDEPWDVMHMAASGDTLFVAAMNKLMIYQYPDPQDPKPVLLGSDTTWAGFFRIFADGSRLYGVRDQTLTILDASIPSSIACLGQYMTAQDPIREIFVLGNYAYLLLGIGNQDVLEIIDVSNPALPVKAGEYAFTGEARDLYVSGGSAIAYVAYYTSDANQGFKILDVSNPASVHILGSAQTPGRPICIWVEQNLLCIGSNTFAESGNAWYLDAYNVENKTVPVHMAQETHPGTIWDVKIFDKMIVASIPNNCLWCYFGAAYLYYNDADFQHFDDFMYYLEGVCPSPVSLFIEYLYWRTAYRYMYWLSMDGYGCTDLLDVSASLGLFIQRFYMAWMDVEGGNAHFKLPKSFDLSQNYPNPFNPGTVIPFTVKEPCRVSLKVFDMNGREVATIIDADYQPGRYEAEFRPQELASGVYLYSIQAGVFRASHKMTIIK